MATDVMMPDLSTLDYIMETGTVIRWFKKEGETVEKGEPLVEIMTMKTVIPIEATASGKLTKILVSEKVEVPPGTKLGVIE